MGAVLLFRKAPETLNTQGFYWGLVTQGPSMVYIVQNYLDTLN